MKVLYFPVLKDHYVILAYYLLYKSEVFPSLLNHGPMGMGSVQYKIVSSKLHYTKSMHFPPKVKLHDLVWFENSYITIFGTAPEILSI